MLKFPIPSEPYRPLHPYQKEAVEQLIHNIGKGISTVLRLPTGTGKTFTAVETFRQHLELNPKANWRIVTPFRELTTSFTDEINNFGIYQGFDIDTYQTLHRKLDQLKPNQYKVILVDECHRSKAATLEKSLQYFNATRIGLSATPERLDGQPLKDYYDEVIDLHPNSWYEENNYLAPVDVYSLPLADILLESFNDQLDVQSDLLDKPQITGNVIKHWFEHLEGKKTIVFCSGREHGLHITEQFNSYFIENGYLYRFAFLDSKTPQKEREQILKDCFAGKYIGLVNIGLFIEGLDWPQAEGCIFLRKTMSYVIWQQAIGRIRRYLPGKTGIVLDHVGNFLIHGHPNESKIYTLEGKQKEKKSKVDPNFLTECVECGGALLELLPGVSKQCLSCGKLYTLRLKKDSSSSRENPEEIDGELVKYSYMEGFKDVSELITKFLRYQNTPTAYPPGWIMPQLEKLRAKGIELSIDLIVYALIQVGYTQSVAQLLTAQLIAKWRS
jgi:superfamily II DNA or RNA helicase